MLLVIMPQTSANEGEVEHSYYMRTVSVVASVDIFRAF